MCSIVCNCFCLIHIKRHLSLSFSDPAPDVPGGAEVDRLALFLESGWSDMALFLSKLKSSFWEKKRKEEDSLIFFVYNIYNCTLAAEQKALSGPFVRWRHTTDVFTSQQIEYAIILKEKKKSRSIAQSFFFKVIKGDTKFVFLLFTLSWHIRKKE